MQLGVRRLRDRLRSAIRGELPTAGLEGLRTAGASAYSLAEEVERLLLEPTWDPWRQEPGTQLFVLCAWNAFALETAADQVTSDPGAPEQVSEGTLAFAQACYAQAMTWIQSARYAQVNPAYRLTTPLPAALPEWPLFEEPRLAQIRALQSACEALSPRADYELGRLVRTAGSSNARDLAEMNLLGARMQTSIEFAGALRLHAQSPEQLREVRDDLIRVLECTYVLGQLAAMPSLVERLRLTGYRPDAPGPVPLSAVEVGWPVVARSGKRIGTVRGFEGEPALGKITGLRVSLGSFSADRRVRVDQLHGVEHGVVRLAGDEVDLERA